MSGLGLAIGLLVILWLGTAFGMPRFNAWAARHDKRKAQVKHEDETHVHHAG